MSINNELTGHARFQMTGVEAHKLCRLVWNLLNQPSQHDPDLGTIFDPGSGYPANLGTKFNLFG